MTGSGAKPKSTRCARSPRSSSQVEARVAAEERLRDLAYHDELTGLANRRALVDHLTGRMLDRCRGPVALIFMDVDRLKAVNSVLGHVSGDQYLTTLARRLSNASGGPPAGPARRRRIRPGHGGLRRRIVAVAMAEKLRRVASEPILLGGEEVSRGVSLGVATGYPRGVDRLPADGPGGSGDAAVEEHAAATPSASSPPRCAGLSEIRTEIELHLGTAIRNGSLVLHYQPEVDLVSGRILGFEALVRWPHPPSGCCRPASSSTSPRPPIWRASSAAG